MRFSLLHGRTIALTAAITLVGSGLAPAVGAAQEAGRASVLHPSGPDEYRIGVEDVLDVSVWRNTDLTRTVQVRPDGKISLPLINDLQAEDLTPAELQNVIAKSYLKFFTDLEISVSVREVHSIKISVLGMVKTPGRYELKSAATVLDALALAAGFSEFAKRDRVFVSRRVAGEWKRLSFNYVKLLAGADEENFELVGGDIVIVP